MLKQAYEINSWGKNVYVKIPVVNSEAMYVAIGGPKTNQQTKAKNRSFSTTIKNFVLRFKLLSLIPIAFIYKLWRPIQL